MKRWAAKLLLVAFSFVFALLLAEVALRITGYSYPYFYTFEEQTCWMHRAGAAGWFRKEGEAYIRINSAGMRDIERAKAKPANTYRIALLGDSFVEAFQVPLEETFGHLLEERLGGCSRTGGRRVEVLNFGVSSYGTAQELIALRSRVWDYDPDMILLAFTPSNDVRNNSRALEQDVPLRPYFVMQGNQLVADMSFRESPVFRKKMSLFNRVLYEAINYSRILQVANSVREGYLTRRKYEQTGAAGGPEIGLDYSIFEPPQDEKWVDAWHVTEGIITQMNREVQERGASFFVVVVTDGSQVNPDPGMRLSVMRKLGVADLFYTGQRLGQLGTREHFPVLDLGPPFQAYAEQNQRPLHGFDPNQSIGHWNREGHRLASDLISKALCETTTP